MANRLRQYGPNNEDLVRAVELSASIAGVCRALGLVPRGGNYRTIGNAIARMGLSTAHFTGQAHRRGSTRPVRPARPLAEVLVRDSDYGTSVQLKKRLLAAGMLVPRCQGCGNAGEWLGRPLVLHLEHRNGAHNDNRLENLALLCPNCHSQSSTYCGRNIRGRGRTAR